jgi:hypothetical protein
MLPPVGAIIVGPCPECQGLVVVFCGQVLGLNREIMLGKSVAEKREHLLEVLMAFVRERIEQVVGDGVEDTDRAPAGGHKVPVKREEETSGTEAESCGDTCGEGPMKKSRCAHHGHKGGRVISQNELDTFVSDDLRLIDNPDYFKAIFG